MVRICLCVCVLKWSVLCLSKVINLYQGLDQSTVSLGLLRCQWSINGCHLYALTVRCLSTPCLGVSNNLDQNLLFCNPLVISLRVPSLFRWVRQVNRNSQIRWMAIGDLIEWKRKKVDQLSLVRGGGRLALRVAKG